MKAAQSTDRKVDASRGPRLMTTALVALGVVYLVASNLTPISESDFWIQLKVGDEIRRTGTIPRTIEYAFTEAKGREFIAHEWLPSTLTSALYPHLGYAGMIVFKCALALAVASLAFAVALRIGGSVVASVLIACAAATAMNFRFQMRPEIFAFLLASSSLYMLTAFSQTGRLAWLAGLLPVSLVWANSHGSILLSLLLPWLFVAGGLVDDLRARRKPLTRRYLPLASVAVSMLAVSLVNPYGIRLLTHALAFSRADWLREYIVEFGSTFDARLRDAPYFWVYVAYLAAVAASLAARWRRINGTSIVLLAVFGWMSIDAIRFTAWFALAGVYVLAHAWAGEVRSPSRERAAALAGVVALSVGIGVAFAHGDVRGHRLGFRNEAPMSPAAVAFVRTSGIAGNVFNTFSHGDQLIHGFYPGIRIAIDSRIDAYGEDYYRNYLSLCGRSFRALGPSTELIAFLDRYDVRTIVTRPVDFKNWSDKGHIEALASAGWSLAFADTTTLILRRPL